MTTHKIVEFRPQGISLFAQFLQWLAAKNSWPWQIEVVPEFSLANLRGALAALVAESMSERVLPQIKTQTTQVRNIECLDSFFFEGGSWYPRILAHEALRMVLVAEARDLDIRAPAFVVGNDESVRSVASVLAEMGIVDIYLVGNVEALEKQKKILSRSHIGIHFQLVDAEDLTLQSVSAGIVVNTSDLSERKSLLTDLSYFNFMKHNGYVLDLNILPRHNLLLEEAERAGLRVLQPVLVAAATSYLWLERTQPSQKKSVEDLLALWEEFLQGLGSKTS